ncbi:MAG: RDD family protein [Victivallaceae bacterium]
MQYIIKDKNNEEHGPVDAETLEKWVDEDRITAETPIRSSLMANWRTADDMAFLKERLAEQAVRREEAATMMEKSGSVLKDIKGRIAEKFVPASTSKLEQKRPYQYANMFSRSMAGLYDLVVILLVGLLIYFAGLVYAYYYPASRTDNSKQAIAEKDNMMIPIDKAAEERRLDIEKRLEAAKQTLKDDELKKTEKAFEAELKAEKAATAKIKAEVHENNLSADCPPYTFADKNAGYQASSIWMDTVANEEYVCLSGAPGAARWLKTGELNEIVTFGLAALLLGVFVVNALCLGYYSQTFGMWFWGIFLSKRRIGEVYFFRAFIFTLFWPLCFIFSPLFVYVFRRGLHEMIADVRLIRVFSRRQ